MPKGIGRSDFKRQEKRRRQEKKRKQKEERRMSLFRTEKFTSVKKCKQRRDSRYYKGKRPWITAMGSLFRKPPEKCPFCGNNKRIGWYYWFEKRKIKKRKIYWCCFKVNPEAPLRCFG